MNDLLTIPYMSGGSETVSYIVARGGAREAILIDPVRFDRGLYSVLRDNDLEISGVLVTHPEDYVGHTLRTLGKVFDFELVSGSRELRTKRYRCLRGADTFLLSGFEISAIPALSQSRTSFMYRLGSFVFSGAIVHAGTLGDTSNTYAEALLVALVKDYLFTLDDDTILLPSVGPPSTIRVERELSPFYREE